MNPPGRFLKQDPMTKLWSDIGKKTALAKTRQALREGAPELLRDMQTMEQFQQYSSSEGTLAQCTNVANQAKAGLSKYLPRSASTDSLGSESLLSLDSMNNDKKNTFQFTALSNKVTGGFNKMPSCVSASSGSSESGDSSDSIVVGAGQMQVGQQHISQWQNLSNMQSFLQNSSKQDDSQFQAPNALLQLENAFNQVNSQVNQHQHFSSYLFNNGNSIATDNTSNFQVQGYAAPNPQQQFNNTSTSTGNNDDAATLMALFRGNNSNANTSGDSNTNSLIQLLQSQIAFQQLQSQLGIGSSAPQEFNGRPGGVSFQ